MPEPQSLAAPGHLGDHPGAPAPAPAEVPTTPTSSTWGWAVLEIRRDGTWGAPHVVAAARSAEGAANRAVTAGETRHLQEISPLVHVQVGSLEAAQGHLHLAAAAFFRGTRAATSAAGRRQCQERLAHVLAVQGDLVRADLLAASAEAQDASTHGRAARAWTALLHDDLAEAERLVEALTDHQDENEPWLAASLVLLRSQLLVATGAPDEATRLLVGAVEAQAGHGWSPWWADLLTVGRAEALLAADEVQRALAVLTPLPRHAHAAASVVFASGLARIGDARGARSVLSGAEEELDRGPLAWRVRAWLLESALAEEREEHDRADVLLDRALRAATPEQLRLPFMETWRSTVRHLDRRPHLMRAHRAFVSTCHFAAPAVPRPRSGAPLGDGPPAAPLTAREEEVLDLLAQMCSTEEIADVLFISVNTVKTHVKGIFGKLCVNRRVEAVRRGRQLGLC